jgi:FkbM family methyltransferase
VSDLKKVLKRLAPRKVRERLDPPHARLSYSQEGEDLILARIFEGQYEGFYVDIGAHHPLKFSNTHIFYMRGWRGINIDACPGSMEVFRQIRPRDINLELAISDKPESLTYYEFNEKALNGFDKDMAAKAESLAFEMTGTRTIETVTLAQVLDKYLPPEQVIDFMNVDVEGLDEQVLRSNNWNKYRPRVILAEDVGPHMWPAVSHTNLVKMLGEHGYALACKTMNTLIFSRERHPREQ